MEALSSDNRSLVFIGFMGAGKTKAAAAVAGALGLRARDADAELQAELGMPIADFFEQNGEEEFRHREAALVGALLRDSRGEAIALGGGAVLSQSVREALAAHVVVWLNVDAGEAWGRVEGSERPLARDRDAFESLHADRAPLYAEVADAIVPGRRDALADATPALAALRGAPPTTKLLWAESASGGYPAFIGPGALGGVRIELPGRAFCVTDEHVGRLHAGSLGGAEATITVPAGEGSKSLAEAERVLAELAENGMRRDDHLVALGGGVVGDLGGFCAAVYQRGVPVVQAPTTLLAQVDSAYGGKTGVDIETAKNYVGAYHLPAAVLADTSTLETLPAEELRSGFVEALKTGLLAGGELWERTRALVALDAGAVAPLVAPCAAYKLEVVAADERDAGRRMELNLGHTVGHAIEAATSYSRFRHGEAVGLGLLAALRISGASALRDEVEATLARLGLPTGLGGGAEADAVMQALELDKKRDAEGVRFVLLERPGEPRVGQLVDRASVEAAVRELL